MKVEFTLKRFPINGLLKDQCGLPFSCVLQPYARLSEKDAAAGDTGVHSDTIARCTQCYSYVNCYCSFDTAGWVCSLCNRHNSLRPQQLNRYRSDPAWLQSLPEVACEVFESQAEEPIPIPVPRAVPGAPDEASVSGPAPVVVALVDTAAGEEFLELVRSSLEAALEALPPVTRFALITMSHRVGLHDVRSEEPCVRYVPLYDTGGAAARLAGGGGPPVIAAPLSDVLPLASLLAPVGTHKAAITRALEEQMVPEQGFGEAATAGPSPEAGMTRGSLPAAGPGSGGCRGLGPALVAVLDYLKVLQGAPFLAEPGTAGGGRANGVAAAAGGEHLPQNQSPVRLMLFLSGVPDYGIGRLINPRRRRAALAAAARASPPPPATPPHAEGAPADAAGAGVAPSEQQPHAQQPAGATAPGGGAPLPAEPDPDAWLHDVPSSSVEFYEQAAAAAASLGASLDLFAVSGGALGLRVLEPLCNATGGSVYLYPSVDESAMPQDVYLRLGAGSASAGLLRLRTSPHFRPVRHYGRLFPDPAIPDLHHITAADPADAFAVDFDFASPSGFAGAANTLPPTLQVAYQYTTLVCERVAQQEQQGQEQGQASEQATEQRGGEGRRYWLQRRLRVATYRVMTAATVGDVYAHAAPEPCVALLLHKIMRAAEAQGAHEARLLLRDWLVILALNYHRNVHSALTPQQLAAVPADLHFSAAPALAPLPRLVYALLRSPLLAPPGEGQHPDLTAFLRHLWASLPPGELVRAVYPLMSSYATPDQPAYPRHSLCSAALEGEGAPPIFLLDAYILILVYYTARAPPGLPFPPPQQSALRKAVAAIRAERRITPQVKIMREGAEDAELFDQLLLDEPDPHPEGQGGQQGEGGAGGGGGGAGGGGGFGLVQFLEHVAAEAAAQLQHEAARGAGK